MITKTTKSKNLSNLRFQRITLPLSLALIFFFSVSSLSSNSLLQAKSSSITSSLADSSAISQEAAAQMDVYTMPATIHNELTGKNQPTKGLTTANMLKLRVCRGEFEPLSLFLQPKTAVNKLTFDWTDFTSSATAYTIAKNKLDVSIVKVWYQAGYRSTDLKTKHLTQELLVKNDKLIKVDYATQTNYLLVSRNGSQYYQNISDPNGTFPSDVTVEDSPTLQPIDLDGTTNRQIWLTISVPEDAPTGKYTSQFTISSDQGVIKIIPIEIEVLPFNLDESRLTYSIYYNGYADANVYVPFTYTTKLTDHYKIEMQDLKDHGVLYPTTYQVLRNLDLDLKIRQEVGLPNDKLFTIGLSTGNPQSSTELNNLKSQVRQWKDKIAQYGYKDLYVYGIDEALGNTLTSQRPAWNAVHEAGAKVFVAGYYHYADLMGDILDIGVIQDVLRTDQADKYHKYGHKIYSYSNPQVGQENPELYRRNYGLALWKAGYDGAMNYAYQKYYKSEWNDFDHNEYREECFTYSTSHGILKTIEWEGFREGVDDIRYLSTLLNKIEELKNEGENTSELESFVASIDPSKDLDAIRSQIIDKLVALSTENTTAVDNEPSAASAKKFELAQNYPNPFNPSTAIKYSIPQNSMVTLKVYDVLGKEVATLVNEQKSAGAYEVNFQASNLATGMYIYELKAGSFSEIKKMMLMK